MADWFILSVGRLHYSDYFALYIQVMAFWHGLSGGLLSTDCFRGLATGYWMDGLFSSYTAGCVYCILITNDAWPYLTSREAGMKSSLLPTSPCQHPIPDRQNNKNPRQVRHARSDSTHDSHHPPAFPSMDWSASQALCIDSKIDNNGRASSHAVI